jgi:hypothetical protein
MGERDVPTGQAGQQGPNGGGAFPREDAFGSVNPAEDCHDGAHGHRVGGTVDHKVSEVVAKRAASAVPVAVELAFGVAGYAAVVAGDTGAGQAYRSGIRAVNPAG